MASNKLMMELIFEMKKSIRDMEKLAGATKKTTKEISKQGKTAKVAGKRVNKFGQHIRRAGGNLRAFTAALTGIGALAGIFFIIGKAVRAMTVNTMESIQATAKLEAVLKATGHAAGLTKMEMDNMSFAMSQNTTFAQTAITEAQGIMATFTKLGRDVFPQAISAAADMSTMFGQTLQQSSIQLGTALNDPINGIGRLMRIGVSFSESQKKQIDLFMAMGDVASAQGVILAELEAEMGGAAEAMEETLIGQIQKWSNNLALAGEQIGIIITMLPSLITFVQGMNDKLSAFVTMPMEQKIMVIMDHVRGWIRGWFMVVKVVTILKNMLATLGAFIGSRLVALMDNLMTRWDAFKLRIEIIRMTLNRFFNGIPEAFKIIIKNLKVFTDNWQTLFQLVGVSMELAILKGVRTMIKELEGFFNSVLEFLKIPAIAEFFGFDGAKISFDTSGLDTMISGLDAVKTVLSEPFKEVFEEIKTVFEPGEQEKALREQLAAMDIGLDFDAMEQTFQDLQEKFGVTDPSLVDEQLQQTLENLGVTEQHLMDQIIEQIKQNAEDKKLIEENNKNLDILNNSWLSGAAKVTRAMEAAGIKMDKLGNSLGQAFAEGGSVREIIGNAIAQTMGNIAQKSTEKSMADWVQGQFAAGDAAGEMAQGLSGLMGGLAGGLVGGLIGKLFSKKPKTPKKPIPVKVVNWGDMTQQLLKASSRRAVSPMITSGGNIGMSSTFNRDMRF